MANNRSFGRDYKSNSEKTYLQRSDYRRGNRCISFFYLPLYQHPIPSLKTMKINTLTHSEELLMNILWKLNSAYMKDVMEAYPEPKPHQNTVSTFMKILVEKEFLTTEKEGRIFKYSVAIPYDDYRKFVLRNFAENYFNNSVPELVKTLLDEQLLTNNELNIIAGITRYEAKDESPISDFINEITSNKKEKKKGKKKDKKKKK